MLGYLFLFCMQFQNSWHAKNDCAEQINGMPWSLFGFHKMESMRKIFLQLFNNTITTIFTKKNSDFFHPKGDKEMENSWTALCENSKESTFWAINFYNRYYWILCYLPPSLHSHPVVYNLLVRVLCCQKFYHFKWSEVKRMLDVRTMWRTMPV